MIVNPLAGIWTYRSFLSNPDIDADFNSLEFGRGNIRIDPAANGQSTAPAGFVAQWIAVKQDS